MAKLKTAAKISPEKMRKYPLHTQIALGVKPKGPIAAAGAVTKKK